MPRGTMIGSATYHSLQPNWQVDLPMAALGGTLIFLITASSMCG
jgi:hypothetical protein